MKAVRKAENGCHLIYQSIFTMTAVSLLSVCPSITGLFY